MAEQPTRQARVQPKSARQIAVLHYRTAPLRAAVAAAALVKAGAVVLASPHAVPAATTAAGGGAGAGNVSSLSLVASTAAALLQCDWGGLEHWCGAASLLHLAPAAAAALAAAEVMVPSP